MRKLQRIVFWTAMVVLVLTGCATQSVESTDEDLLAAQVEDIIPVVSATGVVVPARQAVLSFPAGGTIETLAVRVGDVVLAGDVIASIDSANIEAALAQANVNLAQAEANLAVVSAGPTEEEIAMAESAVQAANARAAAATARRNALYSSVTDAQIADAENSLFDAQQVYNDALRELLDLQEFDPEDCAEYEDNDLVCPLANYEMVENNVRLAELQVQAAQAYLDDLYDGPSSQQLSVENANIWAAAARVLPAQARLDLLLAQPFPEDVAIAEAELAMAQANVALAEAQLTQTILTAPFDAVVTDLYVEVYEFVSSGQPVLQLSAEDSFRIETTDLNEIEVARITVGSQATITFDALPDAQTPAQVARIAIKAEEGTAVNYTVILELQDIPDALRWGMTAFVDIETE